MRVVIAGGERFGGGKAGNAHVVARHFGAAGNHDVGIAHLNHAHRLGNGMGGGRTGSGGGQIGAPQSVTDREIARHHIDQVARHIKRRYPFGAVIKKIFVAFQHAGESTDAGADNNAGAFAERGIGSKIQPAVADGVNARSHAVEYESVHFAQFFFVEIARGIKIGHIAAKTYRQGGSIIICNRTNAAFSSKNILPGKLQA